MELVAGYLSILACAFVFSCVALVPLYFVVRKAVADGLRAGFGGAAAERGCSASDGFSQSDAKG